MPAPGRSSSEEDGGGGHRLGHAQCVRRRVVGVQEDVDVIEACQALLIGEETRVAQHPSHDGKRDVTAPELGVGHRGQIARLR
jgi:hypothetical protein